MSDRGTLEKLTILAFEDPGYSGLPTDRFEAFVNPGELTLAWEFEYDAAQGAGTTAARMNFSRMKPGDLALTFFLDGTGANGRLFEGGPPDVQKMIQRFQVVTGYNGNIHRPNYLKVIWGSLQVRRCVLKSASIAYRMFRADGVPLRAVISASFVDNSDDRTRVALAQDQSSDLTHRRIIRAGDTLPGLCRQIYGNAALYVNVAEYNDLDSIRRLTPGSVIFFPPLEKAR